MKPFQTKLSIALMLGITSLSSQALTTSDVSASYQFDINITSTLGVSWVSPDFAFTGSAADAETKTSYDNAWNFTVGVPGAASDWQNDWPAVSAAIGTDAAATADGPIGFFASGTQSTNLTAAASASADNNNAASSLAKAERWGGFLANDSGSISITAVAAGNGLDVNVGAVNGVGFGGANVFNTFQKLPFNTIDWVASPQVFETLKQEVAGNLFDANNANGFVDTLTFDAGDYVLFRVGVNALASVQDASIAPVPVPASVLLLGSALLGLVGMKRRH